MKRDKKQVREALLEGLAEIVLTVIAFGIGTLILWLIGVDFKSSSISGDDGFVILIGITVPIALFIIIYNLVEWIKGKFGRKMLKRKDIRIRDPFILTDTEKGCYYMYGTTDLVPGTLHAEPRFSVYKSYDLESFEKPRIIFDGEKTEFWADRDYWAPEVHRWGGRYYLFGSCKAEGKRRATEIFVSDTPDGEFVPVSDKSITPEDWECLDGTFFVDDGKPYMVFSHEWVQVGDGEIWAVQLSDDLTRAVGEPFMLFKASDNPEVSELEEGSGNYVTDGPFLYREYGKIKMIWSSFYQGRYLVLDAECDSLFGEWRHGGSRFDFDGGHAMIFTRLDGRRMIALHAPNKADEERANFFEI